MGKKMHRKFNMASHMGHISSILYSFCSCVCVNFKVRVPVHLKVCKASDMCSPHKVCVSVFHLWGVEGWRLGEQWVFGKGGVCVCVWGGDLRAPQV